MRKLFILISALGLVAAACGGDSSADSCGGVADDAIGLIQNMIDEVDSMSLDDLQNLDESPALTNLEGDLEALEEKADSLDCSDAEMEELFLDRVDNLTAETQFGELMLETFKQEAAGGF